MKAKFIVLLLCQLVYLTRQLHKSLRYLPIRKANLQGKDLNNISKMTPKPVHVAPEPELTAINVTVFNKHV